MNQIRTVNDYDYYKVIEDTSTGVMYLVVERTGPHGSGIAITPMLNNDGTPRIFNYNTTAAPMVKKTSEDDHHEILRDTYTGIVYLVVKGTGSHGSGIAITPMFDNDGTPHAQSIFD